MIRAIRPADLDAAAALWLDANREAHWFVPAAYWQSQLAAVRPQLLEAESYVFVEEDGTISGLLGLQDALIAGLFVRRDVRSRGIGRQLLDFAKRRRTRLYLHVYRQNGRAEAFYRREGFRPCGRQLDEATGQPETVMVWEAESH